MQKIVLSSLLALLTVHVGAQAVVTQIQAAEQTEKDQPAGEKQVLPIAVAANVSTATTATRALYDQKFVQNLLDATGKSSDNRLISPWSIAEVLAALSLAQEATSTDVVQTLGYSGDAAAWLDEFTQQRNQAADETVEFKTFNHVWLNQNMRAQPGFVSAYGKALSGELVNINLRQRVTASQAINDWIKAATQGRITQLMGAEDLRGAEAVLVNAMYFKGAWAQAFDPANTQPGEFTSAKRKATVPIMQGLIPAKFSQAQGWTRVELAFKSPQFTLALFLPPETEGKRHLPDPSVRSLLDAGSRRDSVDIRLPRIKLDGPMVNLNGALPKLIGKPLTRLVEGKPIQIAKVVHRATIEWDEAGATAAAATAAIGAKGMAGPPRVAFDRPFGFELLRGGVVLFTGRVSKP